MTWNTVASICWHTILMDYFNGKCEAAAMSKNYPQHEWAWAVYCILIYEQLTNSWIHYNRMRMSYIKMLVISNENVSCMLLKLTENNTLWQNCACLALHFCLPVLCLLVGVVSCDFVESRGAQTQHCSVDTRVPLTTMSASSSSCTLFVFCWSDL